MWVRGSPAYPGASSAPVRHQEQQARWAAPLCSASPRDRCANTAPLRAGSSDPWHPVPLTATLSLVASWEDAGLPHSTEDSEPRRPGLQVTWWLCQDWNPGLPLLPGAPFRLQEPGNVVHGGVAHKAQSQDFHSGLLGSESCPRLLPNPQGNFNRK